MKKLFILSIVCAVACSTPAQWIHLQDNNIEQATAFRNNMVEISTKSLEGYVKVSKRYYKDKYESFINDAAAKGGGKVTPGFARVMGYWLITKYDSVELNAREVNALIVEAQIDYQRLIEGMTTLKKKLQERGLSPEQWQMVAGAIDDIASESIKVRTTQLQAKLEDKLGRLNTDLEAAKAGGEETAELKTMIEAELKRELERKKALDEFAATNDAADSERLKKIIEDIMKKRADGSGSDGGSGSGSGS